MLHNRYYQGPPSDHFDGILLQSRTAADRPRVEGHAPVEAGRGCSEMAEYGGDHPSHVRGAGGWRARHDDRPRFAADPGGGDQHPADPVKSERASRFASAGPKRVAEPELAFEDLPPIDAVLLSHCHYDHLDVATLRRLKAAHAPLIAKPLGNDAIVRAAVPHAQCVVGDWWDPRQLGRGVATTLTPAIHWANRWPSDVRVAL